MGGEVGAQGRGERLAEQGNPIFATLPVVNPDAARFQVDVGNLDRAQLGPVSLDYPDLVLAAVLGGFLAGQRGQRCAATLVTVLAAICFVLVPSDVMCPATVPAAMTLIALRAIGLPRRPEIEALVLEPASP